MKKVFKMQLSAILQMNKFPLYLFCLIWLLGSCAKTREPAPGLLWKITTTDGKESYLFGTMHVYPQDRITISEQAIKALENSGVLATERNVRDVEDQRLFIRHNQHKQSARAYQVLASKHGANLKNMEAELIRIADSHHIRITGLETTREVLDVLSRVPLAADERSEEQILAQDEQLIDLYNRGQVDFVAEEMLDKELGYEARKLLVDQRNLNWLDDIESLTKEGNAFIAVGMGHLGGEKGLVHLLKQKGYTLERIKN